ncbi:MULTISPECIES: hypothetical protein [unclassified Streptomyces]|uniref:hypothetical protein n=1 Tax=unclassified Streptomyces TaxID=2593676 RepID=UPI0013BEAA31|nr:hypothetical protein [Streptomyces sp. CB09001]
MENCFGASRWHYFIEGQNDAQSALDDLREREFVKSWSDCGPPITSLSELVNSGALGEEGAHSITDVDRVIESDDPEYDEDGTVRLLLPQGRAVIKLKNPSVFIVFFTFL